MYAALVCQSTLVIYLEYQYKMSIDIYILQTQMNTSAVQPRLLIIGKV